MSAPPRTTLNFVALRPSSGGSGEPVTDGAGLRFVCRLDTAGFTPKQYRRRRARGGVWAPFGIEDRIRLAYPRARAEAVGRRLATREVRRRSMDAPVETLADEIGELASAISLTELGLPVVGLFLPPLQMERTAEGSLLRSIAMLGRRRGKGFLRSADVIVWTALEGEVLDLWTPIPGTEARP